MLLQTNAPTHRVKTFLGFQFSTRYDMSAKFPTGGSKPILSHPSKVHGFHSAGLFNATRRASAGNHDTCSMYT